MKDTNNLIDYNNWSGTDYTQDITGIYINGDATAASTTNYSTTGESSLRIKNPDVSRWHSVDLFKIASPQRLVTGTLEIYNKGCSVHVHLFHTTAGEMITSIVVPPNSSFTKLTISGDTSNITGNISIRVFPRDVNNSPVYVDNVSLS